MPFLISLNANGSMFRMHIKVERNVPFWKFGISSMWNQLKKTLIPCTSVFSVKMNTSPLHHEDLVSATIDINTLKLLINSSFKN